MQIERLFFTVLANRLGSLALCAARKAAYCPLLYWQYIVWVILNAARHVTASDIPTSKETAREPLRNMLD